MSSEKNSPSIIKLKTLELEINMLIKTYKQIQGTYNNNMIHSKYDAAKKNMEELNTISGKLDDKMKEAQNMINKIVPKGENYQKKSKEKDIEIMNLADKLNTMSEKLDKLKQKNNTIQGDMETTDSDSRANRFQFYFISIATVIVGAITAYSMMTEETNIIENIIAMAILTIGIYFLVKKYFL